MYEQGKTKVCHKGRLLLKNNNKIKNHLWKFTGGFLITSVGMRRFELPTPRPPDAYSKPDWATSRKSECKNSALFLIPQIDNYYRLKLIMNKYMTR